MVESEGFEGRRTPTPVDVQHRRDGEVDEGGQPAQDGNQGLPKTRYSSHAVEEPKRPEVRPKLDEGGGFADVELLHAGGHHLDRRPPEADGSGQHSRHNEDGKPEEATSHSSAEHDRSKGREVREDGQREGGVRESRGNLAIVLIGVVRVVRVVV